jgi:hypothetical protein
MVEKPTAKAWSEMFPKAENGIPAGWERPESAINIVDLPQHSPLRVLAEHQCERAPAVFVPDCSQSNRNKYNKSARKGAKAAKAEAFVFVRKAYGENGSLARAGGWELGETRIEFAGQSFSMHFWWSAGETWRAPKLKLSTSPYGLLLDGARVAEVTESLVMVPKAIGAVLATGVGNPGGEWRWEDWEVTRGWVCLRETSGMSRKGIESAVGKADLLCREAAELSEYHGDNPHGLRLEHQLLAGVALNAVAPGELVDGVGKGVLELPEFIAPLQDQLWGASVGDAKVAEDRWWGTREGYQFKSPFILGRTREARKMAYIGIPEVTLWTAYGTRSGEIAPKEINDPHLTEAERPEAEAFWAEHAFARQDFSYAGYISMKLQWAREEEPLSPEKVRYERILARLLG